MTRTTFSAYRLEKLSAYVRVQPGYAFASEKFTDDPSDCPLVKGENVQQGYVDWGAAKYWPQSEIDDFAAYELRAGDVVVAMDRPWVQAGLKWAYIRKDDPRSLLVQRVARLTARDGLDQTYLRCLISSAYFAAYVQPIVTGVNVPHISGKQIGDFLIPVPDLPVQRKIAAILSAYDDLIANNQRRIALLEDMAEEIYREWFVRLRFPGFGTSPKVGGVPAAWKRLNLRELVRHYIGGGWGEEAPNSEHSEGAYVIRGTDIPGFAGGEWKGAPYRFHSGSNLKSRLLQAGDFVFEVSGGSTNQLLGRSLMLTEGLLEHFDSSVICASFCKLIRFNEALVSPLFMRFFLKLYYETGLVGLYQVQSTGISNYQFEAFLSRQTVLVPDIALMESFEGHVASMLREKDLLAKASLQLKATRDALLPRLISGKLKVDHLDIRLPPSMRAEAEAVA